MSVTIINTMSNTLSDTTSNTPIVTPNSTPSKNNPIIKISCEYLANLLRIDIVKSVLVVTWWYAYFGLQLTKIFELLFKLILTMPDSWVKIIADQSKLPLTSSGKQVHIVHAANEHRIITNKLRLFLRWYWEHGGDDKSVDTNGFNFSNYSRLLNCSFLYCSYLLTNGDIQPEKFFNDVQQFIVANNEETSTEGNMQYYKSSDLSGRTKEELFMGHVDFESESQSQSESQ